MSSIFDKFRKVKDLSSTNKYSSNSVKFFFQLDFDKHGAYLEIVNDKGSSVHVSYRDYSGAKRSILRSIEQISEQQDFLINWDNPEARIYLHEHEYLLEQLQHVDNFIDPKKNKINFQKNIANIQLLIESENEDKKNLQTSLWLLSENNAIDDFVCITESYAYHSKLLTEIEPIGKSFRHITDFDTTLKTGELSKFLSLFFSYFDNVSVTFEDYVFEESSEKIIAEPCLFFDKVDVDNSLHLRIGQSITSLGVDFLDQFEIYRLADVNEIEKKVSIKYIDQQPTEYYVDMIEKLLIKQSGKKKNNELIREDDTFIIPHELAGQFIYKELPQLLANFKVFGAEKLKTYKISTNLPRLDASLSSGIDFLEGNVSLDFGTEKISLFDALQQYQKNRYVLLADGTHALMNEAYMQKLQRLFKKKKEKVQLSFFDLPLIEDLLDEQLLSDKAFKKSKTFYAGFNELAAQRFTKPKEINATLRPYQQQGVKWLSYLQKNSMNGCLADDMGLGKTLQTITLLSQFYPKQSLPTLIVMPKSLIFNWESELKKFAPHLTSYTFYENQRDIEEAKKHHLIFMTYAMLRNEIEILKEQEFFYVILDESQNIKNLQAQITKAAFLLKASHRLALSGTPIENNLGELYALFRFLNPMMFGSAESFNNNYLYAIQKNNDIEAIQELRKKIYPFILRRLKKDVLKDLPDKIDQTLYVEMSQEQRKFYEQRRLFYKQAIDEQVAEKGINQSQFYIFQALNELRQIASIPESRTEGAIISPKLEFLIEQLQDAVLNGHKALVFVNYLQGIELIGEALDQQGIDYVSMSGSTKDRQHLVDRFQRDPQCKVFIMTLKTGGTGLNLTAADMVFIFDPWWNKAAENQAIDRTYRIGQNKKVFSYKLICKDSIEEKILLLQEQKADLFNSIISADSASLKSFSEEDIQFILSK